MNREQLAEKIAEHIGGSDPSPLYPDFWLDKGRQIVDDVWPVLAQVWEEGVLSGYDHTNLPDCNPYREGYKFEDWHRTPRRFRVWYGDTPFEFVNVEADDRTGAIAAAEKLVGRMNADLVSVEEL